MTKTQEIHPFIMGPTPKDSPTSTLSSPALLPYSSTPPTLERITPTISLHKTLPSTVPSSPGAASSRTSITTSACPTAHELPLPPVNQLRGCKRRTRSKLSRSLSSPTSAKRLYTCTSDNPTLFLWNPFPYPPKQLCPSKCWRSAHWSKFPSADC
ncbi:hypothetical protein L1887_03226 [Cichorium endivia]|nr:hypothetical protein L1887_03226 [Cichorium endivia]